MKYKIKITKAYHIAIEDKDGYEVASDWSFLDYKETKKQAEKLLAETERCMSIAKVGGKIVLTSDMLEDTCVDLLTGGTKPKLKLESFDVMEDGSYKLTFDNGDVWYYKIAGKKLFNRKEGQEEWKEVR